jgi:acetyltransferase-like isoleucine patch superfamily enzyme
MGEERPAAEGRAGAAEGRAGAGGRRAQLLAQARLYLAKWRHYNAALLPWQRAALHYELARRGAFARFPLHGNVLEALRADRLQIGPWAHMEANVWITAPGAARITIGEGTFLNQAVMIAALERVAIGAHCMLANGCFVSDAEHRFDDLTRPLTWQGFSSTGPTEIGDDCWLGAHVVVTGGVRIGERCVIGANAVVTHDIPPRSIAVGVPARVVGEVGARGKR